MSPVLCKPMMRKRVAEKIQSHVSLFPPPISLVESRRANFGIESSKLDMILLMISLRRQREPSLLLKMAMLKCGASGKSS
jgi:hypothetical protein